MPTLYEEARQKLREAEPVEGYTPGPDHIIYALQALTLAMLAVGEQLSLQHSGGSWH